MSKDLQHCHALVALVFNDEDDRSSLVSTLMGRMNLDATSVDRFTHEGRPGAVIHMRYRARGANMTDMPRRLAAAAKAADVEYEVLHAPSGFSVKRPELEQDVPPRATTEPTEPIQADWTQATDVHGPDAPFQGALRVRLLGSVDDEWLAALDDVAAGSDVLDVIVEGAMLYAPDPWRGEPVLTQAGEARHTLREEITKFLNLVNDHYLYRVGRPPEDDFQAMTVAALAYPTLKPELLPCVIRQFTHEGQRLHSAGNHAGKRIDSPPATRQERDEMLDEMIDAAAHTARLDSRDDGTEREALIFRSWDGDIPWLVVHVFERGGRTATWQASVTAWPPEDDLAWQEADDHDRFSALATALDEGAAETPGIFSK